MKEVSRFTEIDLLRFLSALAVVFYHFTFHGFPQDSPSVRVWFPALTESGQYGSLGFHLFFIISGFVILMTAMNKSPQEFVISRLVRLYPAFWVCCTLTFIISIMISGQVFKVTPLQWLINMTMLAGFSKTPYIDGVYWTLFIEIKFYLLIFFLMCFNQLRHIHYYLGLWLALSLIDIIHPFAPLETFTFPLYSAYFIAGACFYLIYKEGNNFYKNFLIWASLLMALYRGREYAISNSLQFHTHLNPTVILSLIFCFYVLFFFISQHKTKFIQSQLFVFLGTLTYPLYLIHQNVGLMLLKYLVPVGHPLLALASVVTLMLCLAWLLHVHVEKRYGPILKRNLAGLLNFNPFKAAVLPTEPVLEQKTIN